MKRVVVTGLGALTPIGNNIADFWQNMVSGKSGAKTITRFDASRFRTQLACELHDYHPETLLDVKELRKTDPFTQYALMAADEAIKDSGLDFTGMNPF